MATGLAFAALIIWLGILAAPWRPWSTREQLAADSETGPTDLSDITVLIPARNEALVIDTTLAALARQDPAIQVLLIDDESTDRTAELARNSGLTNITVIAGKPLPADWSGKVWALHQATEQVNTPLTLLLDADIALDPGFLKAMAKKLHSEDRALVSVMAELRMTTRWELLLIPAFIFFFKLLYPFALANGSNRHVAAAAGGCMLVRTEALRDIGGFAAIHDALIDDCALAARFKQAGYGTWIGLTRSAHSLRGYNDLASLWNMVARNAFTQLRYSSGLLLLCTILMVIAFWIPVAGLLHPVAANIALASAVAMTLSYIPLLRYYRLAPAWALTLPLTGTLYLLMTWTSAWRYWRGERSRWKDRTYEITQGQTRL